MIRRPVITLDKMPGWAEYRVVKLMRRAPAIPAGSGHVWLPGPNPTPRVEPIEGASRTTAALAAQRMQCGRCGRVTHPSENSREVEFPYGTTFFRFLACPECLEREGWEG